MNSNNTSPTLARTQAVARVILSIFETNAKQGKPGALAVLNDNAGISYGVHQATHRSGTLEKVILNYGILQPLQPQITEGAWRMVKDRSPQNIKAQAANSKLINWLKDVGRNDPLMLRAQELVFDTEYMQPATAEWQRRGWVEPLSLVVVYDSFIQGSWHVCRKRTTQRFSPADERAWMEAYLHEREGFLLSLPAKVQRSSVYRPQELRKLLSDGNWTLATPCSVRGIEITEADLL